MAGGLFIRMESPPVCFFYFFGSEAVFFFAKKFVQFKKQFKKSLEIFGCFRNKYYFCSIISKLIRLKSENCIKNRHNNE